MKRPDQLAARLRELQAAGVLPVSEAGAALREILAPLLQGGVVSDERRGAGRRYLVRDPAALAAFIAGRFPNLDHPTTTGLGRVAGIARFRDSKAVTGDTPEMVLVRAWQSSGLLRDGRVVGADTATSAHGVFGFVLAEPHRWTLHGRCAVVENPALFLNLEMLKLPVDLAIYGRGRCSERLLEWLADQPDPDFTVQHLPDYDPVGLDEFTRLRGRLGSRVELHAPVDLPTRFARYANRDLLGRTASRTLLARLRQHPLPAVQAIVTLIDQHQAGLEQEALLLP